MCVKGICVEVCVCLRVSSGMHLLCNETKHDGENKKAIKNVIIIQEVSQQRGKSFALHEAVEIVATPHTALIQPHIVSMWLLLLFLLLLLTLLHRLNTVNMCAIILNFAVRTL